MKRYLNVSRPCYDKPHRCPGWAGGGMRYAEVDLCAHGGSLDGMYDKRAYRRRTNRCPECGVLVLPIMVRYLDWRWYAYAVPSWFRYGLPEMYRSRKHAYRRFRDRH